MASDASELSTRGKKRFIPLENNPEVMTALVHKLGLSKSLGFHDVFSIDDPELLAFVPRPASALLLVFPVSEAHKKHSQEEDGGKEDYSGSGPDEEVIWYKQTIGNACGMMALLHAVSNGPAREHIATQSSLADLISKATSLKPVERAELVYESQAIESAHHEAGQTGDTEAPSPDASIDLHFVCFVKTRENNLWELDGARKGPLNRGTLEPDEDVLSENALNLGVRAFLQREQAAGAGELRFSLIVLTENLE